MQRKKQPSTFQILDGNQSFSINGDRFTPGISVSNSEAGHASLSIAAFFLRLVCTNGMISTTEVSASARHISLKILGEFPKVLERVSFELGQQKSQFRISLQTPVENAILTIESFNPLMRNKGRNNLLRMGDPISHFG